MRQQIGCVADMHRCTAARPVQDNSVLLAVKCESKAFVVVALQELSTAHRWRYFAVPEQPRSLLCAVRTTAKLRGGSPVIFASQ